MATPYPLNDELVRIVYNEDNQPDEIVVDRILDTFSSYLYNMSI